MVGGQVAVASEPPPLILNEYNAVGAGKTLEDGGSDGHFHQVVGNGGNWIELVVTQDGLDARGFRLEWSEAGKPGNPGNPGNPGEADRRGGAMVLSDDALWSNLRAGTILTLIEKPTIEGGLDTDTSFDPSGDDWWINVCSADGRYVTCEGGEPGAFSTSNDDWTLTIRDRAGRVLFGPAGEGSPDWPGSGVNSQEVAALQADPSPAITPGGGYNDADQSSFGAPNQWERDGTAFRQDFSQLRARGPVAATSSADQAGPAVATVQLQRLAIYDTPGPTAEIVQFCPSQRLLLAVNPMWNTLDAFELRSLDPVVIEPLPDGDEDLPGVQGRSMLGSPTSVAVHPTEPIAFVSVLGEGPSKRGRVVGLDLRQASRWYVVLHVEVGYHPDSLAVSPDGRWLIVANEAEGHPDTLGTISVVDLQGVTADTRAFDHAPAVMEIGGLGRLLETSEGDVEPEFVAFDPQSRFAVVSCQENDALLLVDLTSQPTPSVCNVIWLPWGSEPDGVAVFDEMPGPDGRIGCVIAVAEEGKFDVWRQKWTGNTVSFTWVDPLQLTAVPAPLARVDVRPLLDPHRPGVRRDPEGMVGLRHRGRPYAAVGIERGDWLMLFDLADPRQPTLVARCRTGSRPEGVIAIPDGDDLILVTGDEGNEGPGSITFTRLRTLDAASTAAHAD